MALFSVMLLASHPPFVQSSRDVRRAIEWAERLHSDQRRDADRALFILHPLEVAALLCGRGHDESVVIAGVLHDVVENTAATIEDVRERFGDRVAGIVAAVTEDASIEDFAQRKAALRAQVARAGAGAQAVYAADKIAKARELRSLAARQHVALGEPRLARRLEHYELSLEMLRAHRDHDPYVDQLAFELWALRNLPPGF